MAKVKVATDIKEVKTYRLELVGAVMDNEKSRPIRKVINTPPIAIDRTLVIQVDDAFMSMSKEDQAAKGKEIADMILHPDGQYQNILFLPKGYQFMRAVEV